MRVFINSLRDSYVIIFIKFIFIKKYLSKTLDEKNIQKKI
jgi:hypothetical protein